MATDLCLSAQDGGDVELAVIGGGIKAKKKGKKIKFVAMKRSMTETSIKVEPSRFMDDQIWLYARLTVVERQTIGRSPIADCKASSRWLCKATSGCMV